MAKKKFPKNAAKPELARVAKTEPVEVLPFVKPEPETDAAPAGMSNLAAKLAKIRMGRALMAAK
jgi:hypothetical protein